MVIYHGEVLLLEAYHLVCLLVDGRHGIGLVAHVIAEIFHVQATEPNLAGQPEQGKLAMPDEPVLVIFGTVGAFRLGIAHHFGAVDCDGDVLAAHGYFKAEPFAVFGQRAVEVAH